MTTKHTPGPWNIYFNSQDDLVILKVFEGGTESHVIARCHSGLENALLIAAAPDLHEACKTFVEWLDREESGFARAGNERDTPEGERAWRDWYNENLRLCALAQEQARAAIAAAAPKLEAKP